MLLFRSEEHLERWRRERDLPRGETMTAAQQWELARIWYSDRMEATWRRRTPDEAQQVFGSIGLAGDFWTLQRPSD